MYCECSSLESHEQGRRDRQADPDLTICATGLHGTNYLGTIDVRGCAAKTGATLYASEETAAAMRSDFERISTTR